MPWDSKKNQCWINWFFECSVMVTCIFWETQKGVLKSNGPLSLHFGLNDSGKRLMTIDMDT